MTTSTVTLVGDVSDLIGNDYDPSRTKVWVQHNTDKVVTDSGPIRLGAATKAVASDGTFTFANVVASTSLVENLQATLWVDWPNTAGPERTRRQVSFGPYDLTGLSGTVDIRTLEETQALDPVASSALLSEMQDLRDEQVAISGIDSTDTAVAYAVQHGATTPGVLSASIEAAQVPYVKTVDANVNYQKPIKNRVGFIGDSITAGGATIGVSYDNSPPTYAMLAGDGRWDMITSAGIGGQTSTQIRARLQSDIIAKGANVCVVVSCMWNDIGQGLSVAQTMANLAGMIDDLTAAGVLPIFCLLTPDGRTGSTSDRRLAAEQRNRKLLELATSRGVRVVDTFTPLVDIGTGTLKTTYDFDGSVHPNPAGYEQLGAVIDQALRASLPVRASGLIAYEVDPTDLLLGQGLHLTDSNSDGKADMWFAGAASGVTPSVTAATSGIGKAQRVTVAGTTANFDLYPSHSSYTTGFAVGDEMELSCLLTTSGVGARIRLGFAGASGQGVIECVSERPRVDGLVKIRRRVPAGTTGLEPLFSTLPGTGYAEISRLTIRNRTALGLDTI